MDVWIDSMIVKYPLEITQNNAPLLNEVNWRPEKRSMWSWQNLYK